MIETKLYKNNKDDMAKYTDTAIWCNSNNAHIEDKGSYYDVCENVEPEPSIDEQLAELDARYNTKKTEYTTAYTAAMMRGDTETAEAIKGYLDTLDDDYDAEYDRIVGEEEE